MTLSHEHESDNCFLALLVFVLLDELHWKFKQGGSNTMKQRRLKRGLEPDSCFWIANEARVRSTKRLDWRVDPPPDLAIEFDVTRRSVRRLGIYEALRVPEPWRLRKGVLTTYLLGDDGRYAKSLVSKTFPGLVASDLLPFFALRDQIGEADAIDQFRAWIRSHYQPGTQPKATP